MGYTTLQLVEAFADLENRTTEPTTRVTIPKKRLTVMCKVTEVCQGGTWVQQGPARREDAMRPLPSKILAVTSDDPAAAAGIVLQAQPIVSELEANEQSASGVSCD